MLGVDVDAVRFDDVGVRVRRAIQGGERGYVCVTGVHGVMESARSGAVLDAHNRSLLTVPDGVPMVWSAKYAGVSEVERVYGPDMMLDVCRLAAREGWSSYLFGASEETNRKLAERLPELVPGLAIAGRCSPPFRELTADEQSAILREIDESGAELVWVGMSTPKQELWMARSIGALTRPTIMFGVGAAFDIHATGAKDAPDWMRRLGLHWLYRLMREPRRLWRRYAVNIPLFVLGVMKQRPRLSPPPDN